MARFICNIGTIFILITVATYHFMIYWGRKKIKYERNNLWFAFFSLNIALYVILNTIILSGSIINPDFQPLLEGILAFGIILAAYRFLSIILNYRNHKLFIVNCILHLLIVVLTPFSIAFTLDWYMKYLFSPVIFLAGSSFIYLYIIFIIWIIKNRLYRQKSVQIVILGNFIIIGYLLFEKLFIMLNLFQYFMNNDFSFFYHNFLFIGIADIIFAYAMADKFNQEHKDLVDLKLNLEQIVKRRTHELELAKEEVEAASRQKISFYINLAHETKTPLTLINNYLEKYIKNKGLTDELAVVKKNVEKLIYDTVFFLDYEKIQNRDHIYQHDQITDFSRLLNEFIILIQPTIEKNNINLHKKIKKNIYIKANPEAVIRIIRNIIFNAIKFTPAPGHIHISLESADKNIVFQVKDSGLGIAAEKQVHIFDAFYQISPNEPNKEGMGLGLFIVKKIVESLNGKIQVESQPGRGSTFRINLRQESPGKSVKSKLAARTIAMPPLPIQKKIKDTEYDRQKRNIFLVEDNPDLLLYLLNELSSDYNIFTSQNGKQALEKIKQVPEPDIIVSDIMMEQMDGYELLYHLNKDTRYNHIPFIFLTAKSTEKDKLLGLNTGAIDFISKPFSLEELKLKIRVFINHRERVRKLHMQDAIMAITEKMNTGNTNGNNWQTIFEEKCRVYNISQREKEIILLINEGLFYKEIGARLYISTYTVIRHVQNLYEKLNVHSKVELINRLFS